MLVALSVFESGKSWAGVIVDVEDEEEVTIAVEFADFSVV